MAEIVKANAPLKDKNDQQFFPLTSYDQIILPNGERWNGEIAKEGPRGPVGPKGDPGGPPGPAGPKGPAGKDGVQINDAEVSNLTTFSSAKIIELFNSLGLTVVDGKLCVSVPQNGGGV